MNRFDRALGLLLILRSGRTHSATALAQRFGVSPRTIYRDIETLAAVGVPVYAENGRAGGFRLVEGYFLPPITFSVGEAVSLLTGLALLGRLRVRPFSADLAAAGDKLLAALPDHRRAALAGLANVIAFEPLPHDSFHPEPGEPPPAPVPDSVEGQIITTFLQSILDQRAVQISYLRAGGFAARPQPLAPVGLLWDRDLWYLVGRRLDRDEPPRLWRADRVQAITTLSAPLTPTAPDALTQLLGRRWLTGAMAQWAASAPVTIRLTPAQAERLQRDWYYGHAQFAPDPAGDGVVMTYGEVDPQLAFALVRWLGAGAELLTPAAWRADLAADLRALLLPYTEQP